MTPTVLSRRDFLKTGAVLFGGLLSISYHRPLPPIVDILSHMGSTKNNKPLDFQSRAEATFDQLMAAFALPGTDRFAEYLHPTPQDRPYASLWPYTGLLAALNALAALPGRKATYEPALRSVLAGLEHYHDALAVPAGYDSYLRAEGGGQKYYDDNEWVGLEFVRAYQLLGDAAYLSGAEEAFRFAVSGWSNTMGGGIYWRQGDDTTKNTCSNGPAAVLALQLYQATGDPAYLDWGRRILDWVKFFKSPDSGVYWDNRSKGGSIDRQTYTYNTGTVLHACALLYSLTGETEFLEEARGLAKASVRHFAPGGLFPATPWFNAVLLRGYRTLAEVDPSPDKIGVGPMKQYLDAAWENARGADGLFRPDASGQAGREDPHRWILDQAGMVELYALLA